MTASTARAANWQAHFFSFWTGQALSLFGTALVQFALIWWLTSATHSATVLATASLASLLPGFVFLHLIVVHLVLFHVVVLHAVLLYVVDGLSKRC